MEALYKKILYSALLEVAEIVFCNEVILNSITNRATCKVLLYNIEDITSKVDDVQAFFEKKTGKKFTALHIELLRLLWCCYSKSISIEQLPKMFGDRSVEQYMLTINYPFKSLCKEEFSMLFDEVLNGMEVIKVNVTYSIHTELWGDTANIVVQHGTDFLTGKLNCKIYKS